MAAERDLAEMLDRRVQTISLTPTDAAKAVRRARMPVVRNVAALLFIVAVVVVFAGVRTIR